MANQPIFENWPIFQELVGWPQKIGWLANQPISEIGCGQPTNFQIVGHPTYFFYVYFVIIYLF